MKVAFLNTYSNGSTGNIVRHLRNICSNHNIETISIYSRGPKDTDKYAIRLFNKLSFYLDALNTRIFDNHGLNNYINTKRIIRILEAFKPSIIHIHNLHGYWINYRLLFNYIHRNQIKVVWTFHDCWPFTGHCTHFDYIKCNKWEDGCYACPQLREYPSSFRYDGSERNYRLKSQLFSSISNLTIVTPSIWLKNQVIHSFFKNNDVRVINNGIDTSIFNPQRNEALRDSIFNKGYTKIILGVAATWTRRKGIFDIIKLADMERQWYFILIGDLPLKLDWNLHNNIYSIKRTDNVKQLCELYSSADVFINPTLEDTYPTTNLEAIACGTPVVTYPTGGSKEIVEKSFYGIVSEEQSPHSMHKSIIELFNKSQLSISANFNLDRNKAFDEYLKLYQNI